MKIELQRVAPAEIEKRSMEIITEELGGRDIPAEQRPIVLRCIHTSADFDYADNLVFSPGAVAAGVAAVRAGAVIVTDTQMARSGVNKRVLERFGGECLCFMSDPDVARAAKARGVTRAAVSMERAAALSKTDPRPMILALGNAPTALVIGAPVGFVNVVESKELALAMPGAHIVARGRKGGSNIAAAICNALLYMASNNVRE